MIQCVPFWDWVLSLSIMPLRLIQIVFCINSSLLFIAEQHYIVMIYYCLFKYSSFEREFTFRFGRSAVSQFLFFWLVLVSVLVSSYYSCVLSRTTLPVRRSWICSSMFSSIFMVFVFMFRSLLIWAFQEADTKMSYKWKLFIGGYVGER